MPVVSKQRRRHRLKPRGQRSYTIKPTPSRSQRTYMTSSEKLEIIWFCRFEGCDWTQAAVAEHFRDRYPRITQRTVSRLLSQEAELIRLYVDPDPYPGRDAVLAETQAVIDQLAELFPDLGPFLTAEQLEQITTFASTDPLLNQC
ncbi:hypothetical protein FRC12_008529 [Ceratobasidium sp. 428]|nr:hypothetical protein FRC12_008529 [Ceratobasidium sp. 428]